MASKLYVGGLSYSTTSESLREYFAQCGTVESATVITDRFSGQSRGFGFVEMSSESAAKAIASLNGKDFGGRALNVNEAKPREAGGGPRSFGGSGSRSYGSGGGGGGGGAGGGFRSGGSGGRR